MSRIFEYLDKYIELFDIIFQIMFLFLDISIDHFDVITENSSLDGRRASFHFTNTYEFKFAI